MDRELTIDWWSLLGRAKAVTLDPRARFSEEFLYGHRESLVLGRRCDFGVVLSGHLQDGWMSPRQRQRWAVTQKLFAGELMVWSESPRSGCKITAWDEPQARVLHG